MAVKFEDNSVVFSSIVYEDEVKNLRDFLQKNEPNVVKFDFSSCDDVHLSILQVVLAYKKMYDCNFVLPSNNLMYKKVIEGFVV